MKNFISILLMGFSLSGFAQEKKDSCITLNNIEYCNIPKNKLWGNSWCFSSAYNMISIKEIDFNISRTYGKTFGGHVGGYVKTRSLGLGINAIKELTNKYNFGIKAFYEWSFFYIPILPIGIRVEGIFNVPKKEIYSRVSFGASFTYLDIFYNYTYGTSIKMPREDGLSIRLKYFIKPKKWERAVVN